MKAQMNVRRDRRGFTLIELVVVLLVLAGLAGILVPVVQNVVMKTHGSSGASNITEVAKAIQLYQAQFFRQPSGYDSLLTGTASALGTEYFTVATLEEDSVETLRGAGILNVFDLAGPAIGLDTFAPYPADPAVSRPIADTGSILVLTQDGIDELNLLPGVYAAFGVGSQCDLVGTTMLDAPVHFPESGSPTETYSRLIAIYQLGGATSVTNLLGTDSVRLVTVAGLHAHDGNMEPASLGKHLEEYYEN